MRVIQDFGQPEVGQHNPFCLNVFNEDVLGFDVAVNHRWGRIVEVLNQGFS